MATGQFDEDDLGVSCYHGKTGAVELYLNHLVDGPGEYVVVDMTAGADTFASGLFTRFDVMFLVVEPTRKGVSVYRQYTDYAGDYGIDIAVVGNKIQSTEDVAFLRAHVGDDLLACIGHLPAVRAMEQSARSSWRRSTCPRVRCCGGCKGRPTRVRRTGRSSPGRRSSSTSRRLRVGGTAASVWICRSRSTLTS